MWTLGEHLGFLAAALVSFITHVGDESAHSWTDFEADAAVQQTARMLCYAFVSCC